MTLLTPSFLQNAGNVNTAEMLRNAIAITGSAGRLAASSLKPRGGVHFELGGGMFVSQNGVPNMTVNVAAGGCAVPGTEGASQGCYYIVNDGTVNLAITAAHATLNRIDIVVVRIQDQAYSGALNVATLEVVAGTPAASPAAPAAPANSLILAQVSIPATDTTITTSQITDKRTVLAAPGGQMWCPSTNRPDTAQISVGQIIYEYDTNMTRQYDGAGWRQILPYLNYQVLGVATHPVTFSSIPSTLKNIKITFAARCAGAVTVENMTMRINNLSAGQYLYLNTIQNNTSVAGAVNGLTSNHFPISIITGASATANYMGGGVVEIVNWNMSTGLRASVKWSTGCWSGAAATSYNESGFGTLNDAGPLNRIDFRTNGGSNFIVGSFFKIEGWE